MKPLAILPPGSSELAAVSAPRGARPSPRVFPVNAGEQTLFEHEPSRLLTREEELTLHVRWRGPHVGVLRFLFMARGEREPRLVAGYTILPDLWVTLRLPLSIFDIDDLRLPRTPGVLTTLVNGQRLDPAELDRVCVNARAAVEGGCFEAGALLEGARPEAALAPTLPVVDPLGQWMARDWSGRTRSIEEMQTRLRRELRLVRRFARARPEPPVAHRVEQTDGRWAFVDPEGRRFFSLGINCISHAQSGPMPPAMESLLVGRPRQVERLIGGVEQYSFQAENLRRAFGEAAYESWAELTESRLRRWGINTVGNWSDEAFLARSRLPHVWGWPAFPRTATRLFRDLPDVFSPDYEIEARRCAEALRPRAADGRLLGAFMMNEPHWAFGRFNLAAEMLVANPGTHTRRRLAAWMAERYGGDAAALARAWGGRATGFEEFERRVWPDLARAGGRVEEDLWEFSRLIVRRFVGVPAEAARAVAPAVLNLGVRYAWLASPLLLEGAEHFDVYTVNNYSANAPVDTIREIGAATGRPVLVGEFHFGALDRGLPSAGLRAVATQADRAVAIRRYVETLAAEPWAVGAHYFQLNDQPLLGRFDGENYQIGLVDVCHRPYREVCAAFRAASRAIPEVRAGRRAPFDGAFKEIPRVSL